MVHEYATIHNFPYADDVPRVTVLIVYDADAQVPFSTSEIQYVKETHLVKPISNVSTLLFPYVLFSNFFIVNTCRLIIVIVIWH